VWAVRIFEFTVAVSTDEYNGLEVIVMKSLRLNSFYERFRNIIYCSSVGKLNSDAYVM
jgi:hypothetical protein